MAEIKTRDVVKGTIKSLDRSTVAGERMKKAYIKTREKAEHSVYSSESSPEEYASAYMEDTAGTAVHETAHLVDRQIRKSIRGSHEEREIPTAQNPKPRQSPSAHHPATKPHQSKTGGASPPVGEPLQIHRDSPTYHSAVPTKTEVRQKQVAAAKKAFQKKRQEQQITQARLPPATDTITDNPAVSKPTYPKGKVIHAPSRTIKTVDRTTGTIRQRAVPIGKASVKSADRTIKTAEHTVKPAEKVSEITVKSAQKSAKAAAIASKRAVAAAKAATSAVKSAAAITAKIVRAIIAAAEQLVSALMAGGSLALVVVIVILMIGMILGSSFGIFFNNEMEDNKIQDVIREINTLYEYRLDSIEAANPHDEVEMSGSRAPWADILAVYAVKTTTDPDNPLEVVTMDDEKKALLVEIFWEMNELDYEIDTRTETEIQEIEDENGDLVEAEVEVERKYLLITISHKSPEEMAELYGFDSSQREQLEQLLDEEFSSMWLSVLYGVRVGENDIVAVALSQLGNVGGEPYWSWYGFPSREEWCACFVSWCAEQCGYIEAGAFPKFAGCDWGVYWFRSHGQWVDQTATPVPGAIIFFDWDNKGRSGPQDGTSDHVGIVEKVEDGRVHTIEGNSGDACRQRSYPLGHFEILGYGIPAL